jgi:hypothetical protein
MASWELLGIIRVDRILGIAVMAWLQVSSRLWSECGATAVSSGILSRRVIVGPACRAGLRGLPRPARLKPRHSASETSINPLTQERVIAGSAFGESPFRQKGPIFKIIRDYTLCVLPLS